MTEIRLHEEEYYQRAYGAWLGKNIGGTLGEPVEGRKERLDLSFYPELPAEFDTTDIAHYPDATDEGEPTPLANDDLDLQLIWLHALEQYGVDLTATELGREWIDHVFFPYNEYRYALANLRRGIDPPVAGRFNNGFYNDCMGAPIRSEIWALVAPGAPDIAAAYAHEDAVVDHAGGEGVFGEMFNAALESAAFVEDDPRHLIDVGLAYVPDDCCVARAIRDVVTWHREGYDWETTRQLVLDEYGHPDMTNASQNLAFVVLGWLYGEDFGDALLKCVNCGYDTDSSGATLGSILGILHGKDGIPERWVEPIGHSVVTRPQVKGFPAPGDLGELTDRTLAMAKEVIAVRNLSVSIESGTSTAVPAGTVESFAEIAGRTDPRPLWERDPWTTTVRLPRGSRADPSLVVEVTFGDGGPSVGKHGSTDLRIAVENTSEEPWHGDLGLAVPDGWDGPDPRSYDLRPDDQLEWDVSVRADGDVKPSNELTLRVDRSHDGSPWATTTVDLTLVAATHWRLAGPDIPETEVTFPDNRLAVSDALSTGKPGRYTARTALVTPQERTVQLEVHSSAAVVASLDGDVFIDRPPRDEPDMLATDLDHHSDAEGINLEAGEHELEIEFQHDSDGPLAAYVVPAATGRTTSPGGYYFLTDVLFA